MNKIIALSSNGFQLDEWLEPTGDGYIGKIVKKWFTCDKKKIIDLGRFKDLKVGLELKDIKFNKDGKYVIDFTILKPNLPLCDCSKDDLDIEGGCPRPFNHLINSQSSPEKTLRNPEGCVNGNESGRDTSTLKVVEGVSILESDGGKLSDPLTKVKPLNSLKSPSSIQDNILYGQCINIVFAWAKDKTTHDLSLKEDRLYLKNLVNELFNDLKRN